MIMSVICDQRPIENGQVVAFITGLKKLDTLPKYLRVGEVIDAKDFEIKEFKTNKIWRVYPSNIITIGDEGKIQFVSLEYALHDNYKETPCIKVRY